MPENQTKKSFPKWKFKVGRVDTAVWENGEHWNVKFTVSYKKPDDQWASTDSFSKSDLGSLALSAHYAGMLILGEEAKR